jgi:hypothetical protein
MQVHLLVHPLRHRMVVVVISSYKTGQKRQKALVLTNRTPILSRKSANPTPERQWLADKE